MILNINNINCNNLYYLYSISHCFRYSKYEENRTSINFLLHLSASVLMHGSWVKVAQKSTLHFEYVSCHEDQDQDNQEDQPLRLK